MKNALILLVLVSVGGTVWATPQKAAKQANCELRLTSQAGAGEALLSLFTPSEEECLAKSDNSVEAKFRNRNGRVVGSRGGACPEQ